MYFVFVLIDFKYKNKNRKLKKKKKREKDMGIVRVKNKVGWRYIIGVFGGIICTGVRWGWFVNYIYNSFYFIGIFK